MSATRQPGRWQMQTMPSGVSVHKYPPSGGPVRSHKQLVPVSVPKDAESVSSSIDRIRHRFNASWSVSLFPPSSQSFKTVSRVWNSMKLLDYWRTGPSACCKNRPLVHYYSKKFSLDWVLEFLSMIFLAHCILRSYLVLSPTFSNQVNDQQLACSLSKHVRLAPVCLTSPNSSDYSLVNQRLVVYTTGRRWPRLTWRSSLRIHWWISIKDMGVSKNRGGPPKSSICSQGFPL